MASQADPIGSVLAAHRSTEAHVSADLVTEAWALYDRIRRPVLERLREEADVHPCADCDLPTSYAIGSYWLADDELWKYVVGDDTLVLCPRCFHDRAAILGVAVRWQAVPDE